MIEIETEYIVCSEEGGGWGISRGRGGVLEDRAMKEMKGLFNLFSG